MWVHRVPGSSRSATASSTSTGGLLRRPSSPKEVTAHCSHRVERLLEARRSGTARGIKRDVLDRSRAVVSDLDPIEADPAGERINRSLERGNEDNLRVRLDQDGRSGLSA